jgi:flavin reductase (DIM6/NTAB) family NADH-FMN oxidoreductase RutF
MYASTEQVQILRGDRLLQHRTEHRTQQSSHRSTPLPRSTHSHQHIRPPPHLIQNMVHTPIHPAILYWGTPVVLITTLNPDGLTSNIGPMSSAFWLGNRCMLGLQATSQTTVNLLRERECVLNLPSDDMIAPVNKLARTTGTREMPAFKQRTGYRYDADKWATSGLTGMPAERVKAPRITECPVQMEARVVRWDEMMGDLEGEVKGFTLVIEVEVLRTYVEEGLRLEGHENRIDPEKWRPMIMSFQHLYGLRSGRREESKLAEIEEELYRLPVD